MNVFDFDKTIYAGDSTYDFVLWCMRRYPKALLYIPKIAFYCARYYTFHIGTKTQFKEKMYSFLKVCDAKNDVQRFWSDRITGIKAFYRQIHRDDDVIISASPEFLLKPLEDQLNITVIASKVDPDTGRYDGLNCFHQEKVHRFRECFPEGAVESFYSDSYSDEPLAKLAERAYIVKGENVTPWDHSKHKKRLRT